MLTPLSQIEIAHRDTLIRKSEGRIFDTLARFWTFPRLTVFSQSEWRDTLHALAWSPRGTLGSIFSAVEALYAQRTDTIPITLDPASPKEITRTDGVGWSCDDVGRLIRVEYIPEAAVPTLQSERFPEDKTTTISHVFYSIGPALLNGGISPDLELAPFRSGYWKGARWDFGPLAVSGVTTGTAQVLRFLPLEDTPGPLEVGGVRSGDASRGAACRVELLTDTTLFSVPSTYLLDPGGVDRDAVDVFMPDQGHIMDEFNLDAVAPTPPPGGDQLQGPLPIYLQAGQTVPGLGKTLDPFLASGVELVETAYDWCDTPNQNNQGALNFGRLGNIWLLWM